MLPDEILVHIFYYIYNDNDKNYKTIYRSGLINLKLISKKINWILTYYEQFIHNNKKHNKTKILNILNGRFDYIPDKKLQINKYRNYKNTLTKLLIGCLIKNN